MLRTIGGVILGYLTMAVLVFATFTVAYVAMGAEGAFEPGSYQVTPLWLVTSFVLGFLAALTGGLICAGVARSPKAPLVLAGIVLALGLLLAIPALTASNEVKPREGAVGNFDAMQNAQQPGWVALLTPVLGAAGVFLGGRLRRRDESVLRTRSVRA